MRRKFIDKTLVIASHNPGKIDEIMAMLKPFSINVLTAKELALPEPEETGTTYMENAILKAKSCVNAVLLPSLADDSGIEVMALGGLPGVDTAPYTKSHGGREQVFALWQHNPNILADPRACFKCVQVLAWPDGHYEHFEASVNGRLTFPPRGHYGHGYDPVFIPDGHDRTVAQMSPSEKNQCSHRYLALKALIEGCF